VCGDPLAIKSGLFVGLSENGREVVVDGKPTADFDSDLDSDKYVVPSDEDSTVFYVYTSEVSRTYLNTPYCKAKAVIADEEKLDPTLNGTGVATDWLDNQAKAIEITYNCLEGGGVKAEVELVLELPYFSDVHFHFLKECGTAGASGAGVGIGLIFFM
jgi:hypothetical protein